MECISKRVLKILQDITGLSLFKFQQHVINVQICPVVLYFSDKEMASGVSCPPKPVYLSRYGEFYGPVFSTRIHEGATCWAFFAYKLDQLKRAVTMEIIGFSSALMGSCLVRRDLEDRYDSRMGGKDKSCVKLCEDAVLAILSFQLCTICYFVRK